MLYAYRLVKTLAAFLHKTCFAFEESFFDTQSLPTNISIYNAVVRESRCNYFSSIGLFRDFRAVWTLFTMSSSNLSSNSKVFE